MGRPLRKYLPGQTYLVTARCHQSRLFLRPDDDLNAAILEWLARAQRRYPRLRIYAVCAMSNHLHLVVRDDAGDLAAWACYFLGHLARAVNRIRGRSGACFGSRYRSEPIPDAALLERVAHVVTNPVRAGLFKTVHGWPGVLLFADRSRPLELEVPWVDRDRHRSERAQLVVDPPCLHDRGTAGTGLRDAISAREREIARKRRWTRSRTLTRAQILAQSWQAAPQ